MAALEKPPPDSPCLEIQGLFLLTPTSPPAPLQLHQETEPRTLSDSQMANLGDLPDGNLTSGPSRWAWMTKAPGRKNSVDISVLYHLQTPLDAIKESTAIALGRTPTPDPAETGRLTC